MLIRKETVRTVIALANAATGGHISSNDRHLLETAGSSIGVEGNWKEVFDRFLRRLSQQEVAELLVLRLLGKEQTRDPGTWDNLVAKAGKLPMIKLYDMPVERLPQYLRLGMERLVRSKFKKPVKQDPVRENRRIEIIGNCLLEIYRERYGKEAGLKTLGNYLSGKGYLQTTEDRALFGLPPEPDTVEPQTINLDNTII